MPVIQLSTTIKADIKTVFDLSRSVEMHMDSTQHTYEKAITGRTSGLLQLGETVTWRAKHFGIYQTLTAKITHLEAPTCFVDEMVTGIFNHFKHTHLFESVNDQTIMHDIFDYTSPLGLLGKIADTLFLKRYMTNFLITRNLIIKEKAETLG